MQAIHLSAGLPASATDVCITKFFSSLKIPNKKAAYLKRCFFICTCACGASQELQAYATHILQ
jgi:hypothetical protein